MRTLTVILMLLGALSVLMLGAISAPAQAGEGCHEAAAASRLHHEAPAPPGKPGKATTAMTCCVSCVVAPALQPPGRQPVAHPAAPGAPVPVSLPAGLSPAPEHGPPKA